MPIYEYYCSKCNKIQPKIRQIEHRNVKISCDKCGTTMEWINAPKGDLETRRVNDVFRKV